MNRKLRNTILAFSVTGTVLALALIAASPVPPAEGLQPADVASVAGSDDAGEPHRGDDDRQHGSADTPVHHMDVEARVEARSRQFEEDIAQAASLESALALAAGFVAATTAEAVAAEILSGQAPAAAQGGASSAVEAAAAPHRRRGSVRRAVAVPYFSFARAGHGGRS